MALSIRKVAYFYTTVEDAAEHAASLLSLLASEEIDLLAFSAVPFGPQHTQLTIFPESPARFLRAAEKYGLSLLGPQHAILVQGDDRLGALADVHRKLTEAKVSVYASTGVTDGHGHFGYLVYVREQDHEVAAAALEADEE